MKRQLSLLFATALLLACTTGCFKKPSPAPAPIPDWEYPAYQEYSARFNKTQQTTTIYAELRLNNESGKYLNLTNDSTILVNGQQYLHGDLKVLDSTDDIFFTFRRKNRSFNNHASMSDIRDINFSSNTPAEISLNNDLVTFTWDGEPLAANEEADISFEGYPGTPGQSRSYNLGLANKTIKIKGADLSAIGAGNCKMRLTRLIKLPLTQADSTAGGVMRVKLSVEQDVLLK